MVAVLLRFFKDPRNDEIALQHFFFFLTAAQEFFFYYICAACNFFLPTSACREFFFQNHPPPPPSRVKCSAPNCQLNCLALDRMLIPTLFSHEENVGSMFHNPAKMMKISKDCLKVLDILILKTNK